jgi:peptide/nickel transport system substrate-binding protein
MKTKSKFRFTAIIFIIIACIISTVSWAESEDSIKVVLNADPVTINPLEFKSIVSLPITFLTHQGIMGSVNPKTKMRVLRLAESVKVMKNPKDIRIKLRKGIMFHSGDPVTAHDVKFTVEQVQDPINANSLAGPFNEIEEVEIIDDHTLIYHFYEPFAPWQEVMWIGICSKKQYENVGRKKFRKSPAGAGTFRLIEREIDEHVILEAVEDHPDFRSEFKQLKFFIVKDPATRVAMLETKEADLISRIQPEQVKRLEGKSHIKIKKTSNWPNLFFLAIRPSLFPVLKDINIRKAMIHAINRKELIDKILLNEGYPLFMWANKNELGYDPSYKIEYNPNRARQLLKQSSYKPGTPITLTYSSNIPKAALVATIIQDYLKNIGMTVNLQQLEWGTWLTYSFNRDKRGGHMMLSQFSVPFDPYLRLSLSLKSDGKVCHYFDRPNQAAMDALVTAQSKETNLKKRLSILKKIHQLNNSDPANIPLYGLNMIYGMNKRIDYTWRTGTVELFDLDKIKITK